jgi:hypothetical protein
MNLELPSSMGKAASGFLLMDEFNPRGKESTVSVEAYLSQCENGPPTMLLKSCRHPDLKERAGGNRNSRLSQIME